MRRRAFMMADAIAGLTLLATLATLLAVAVTLRAKTATHLVDQRQANNLAQEALANLQSTGDAKMPDDSAEVSVDRTGKRIGDREWVEVKVIHNGRHASIAGLAPATQPGGGR
jgi:hypothetical protein